MARGRLGEWGGWADGPGGGEGSLRVLAGWFEDTLPKLRPALAAKGYPVKAPFPGSVPLGGGGGGDAGAQVSGGVAFLRCDADMFASTHKCLDLVYPLLSPGGLVYIDDYHEFPACKQVKGTSPPPASR